MKKFKEFIKYPLIETGGLLALIFVFLILALCGVFRHEHNNVGESCFLDQQSKGTGTSTPSVDTTETDVWIEEPGRVSGVPNSILHRYLVSQDDGYYKLFHSKGSQKFYYNGRHGYFVLLPKEMGYNQQGEHQLGAHWNEFYNTDTTLVIACGAIYYDVVLIDYPQWEDSLRNNYIKRLSERGKVQFLSKKPKEITAKVFIDKTNTENPPSDYLLSKWILKKDIDSRECDMSLDIWYVDSLKYRESEFLNILNKFPHNPFK